MNYKFDFEEAFVNQVLAVIQEAHMPSRITNPLLNEFSRQIKDTRIQSLAYPAPVEPESKAEVEERERARRNRPMDDLAA